MKVDRLEDMVRGWFVGDFEPTSLKTDVCEIGVKHYEAGDQEEAHYHKIATEVTLVLSGEVEMCEKSWKEGDIITLEPGEITRFKALSDATTVVVKVPGALDDKYLT